MSSSIYSLITILVLLEVISLAVTVQNLAKATSNNTNFGGLSTESIDIAESNETDLIRNNTNDSRVFGGLSTESIDIAQSNETDLIRNTTSVNNTNFGGLSTRSVNIAK